MKLLLHICCSNCGLYPMKKFMADGIDFVGLWFNPNIHPEPEYRKRLDSLQSLQKLWGLTVEYVGGYGLGRFLNDIGNPDHNRCTRCYALRLDETAKTAKAMGLDGFSTTLMVSPYQNFDGIVEAARESEKRYALPFYLEDFRSGYRSSVGLSKDLGLYRQKYCGCMFSTHG